MKKLSQLLSNVSASPTLGVDIKTKRMKAAGRPVIGFGAGEPDFPTPPHIVEAAQRACSQLDMQKYSPTKGLPEFREAIARKTLRDSGLEIDPNDIVVTNGGKQAVFNAMAALLNPGDELLLPSPYWNTYEEAAKLAGAKVIPVSASIENGFKVTVEQLDALVTPNTKVLAFISPSNPTGTVYSREEIIAIGKWALQRNLWIVTDEIYEHLTYDGIRACSLPVEVPELKNHTLVVNGLAKTYSMTGWRVGWVTGPSEVISVIENYQSHTTSHVNNISQVAGIAALEGGLDDVVKMRYKFDERRKTIHSLLNSIPGTDCLLPQGAFYVFPDFRNLISRNFFGQKIESTTQFADTILENSDVAFVSGEAFHAPGFGRFSYALGEEDIVEGITRMRDCVERGLE